MTGVTIALFCLTGRDYNSTVKRRPFKTLKANQPDGASGAARGSRPTNDRRHNSPFLRDEEKSFYVPHIGECSRTLPRRTARNRVRRSSGSDIPHGVWQGPAIIVDTVRRSANQHTCTRVMP